MEEEKKPLEPINYAFMDGLRGIGSFAVYLHHFMLNFFMYRTEE